MLKNRKGFMLAEVVVVSVVVSVVLVSLFTGLNRVSSAFEERNRYFDIDAAYIASGINGAIIKSNSDTNINSLINTGNIKELTDVAEVKKFTDAYLTNSTKKINAYFSLYNKNKISSLKAEVTNETFKDYIDYLSEYFDYNDDYTYVIIVEYQKSIDNTYYYTLRVR